MDAVINACHILVAMCVPAQQEGRLMPMEHPVQMVSLPSFQSIASYFRKLTIMYMYSYNIWQKTVEEHNFKV